MLDDCATLAREKIYLQTSIFHLIRPQWSGIKSSLLLTWLYMTAGIIIIITISFRRRLKWARNRYMWISQHSVLASKCCLRFKNKSSFGFPWRCSLLAKEKHKWACALSLVTQSGDFPLLSIAPQVRDNELEGTRRDTINHQTNQLYVNQ